MEEPAIEIDELTRYFGKKAAVRDMSLAVGHGEALAILGRKGSGKTTTIRMLLGIIEPTRGTAKILGHSSHALAREVVEKVGYTGEGHPVYGWMRVREYEKFQSRFYRRWNRELFDVVLEHFRILRKTRAGDLSRGQRAGLVLALTLAPEPDVLILDDPILGLDPIAHHAFVESMVYFKKHGKRTILLSSHVLNDVERVADKIAILDRGVLRACCPVPTLRDQVRRVVLRFDSKPPEARLQFPEVIHMISRRNEVLVTMFNTSDASNRVFRESGAIEIHDVPISLEDAVMAYMGEHRSHSFDCVEARR